MARTFFRGTMVSITVAALLLVSAPPASADPGQRDATFSNDGLAPTFTNRYKVAMGDTADGGVVVALYRDSDAGFNGEGPTSAPFRIIRYGPTGAIVPMAETARDRLWQFSPVGLSYAAQVSEDASGDLVVSGGQTSGGGGRLGVLRVDASGTYDPTFTGDGRATYKVFSKEYDLVEPFRTDVLPDGRIGLALIAGNFAADGSITVAEQVLVRLTATGQLDTSFSGDGRFPLAIDDSDVAFLPDGSVYYGRKVGNRHEVRKLTAAGTPDASFNGGTASVACGSHRGGLLNTNAADLPVLACVRPSGTSVVMILHRFGANGLLDPTYGVGGKATVTKPLALEQGAFAVWDIDREGRLWLVSAAAGNRRIDTWRVDGNGQLDPTFSGDGKASTTLPWYVDPFGLRVGDTRAFIALQRSAATSVVMAIEA
jgi:uncharacterized delta-60 repeat protein